MSDFRTFEDLECWQACRKLKIFVSKEVMPRLPREEKYRLGDQVTRAARSTTANIAEGYGRFHYLDKAKFCSNARGSAYEVLDHLITALDEGMIPCELHEKGRQLVEQSVRLLNGYISYLQHASKGPSVREHTSEYVVSNPQSTNQPIPNQPIPPSNTVRTVWARTFAS